MIFEMRIYTILPGKRDEYISLFKEFGLGILCKYAKLIGYWYTETGNVNQIVHIWSYESFEDRSKKRILLYQDLDWKNNFLPQAFPLLERQESKILLAVNFSPIQ